MLRLQPRRALVHKANSCSKYHASKFAAFPVLKRLDWQSRWGHPHSVWYHTCPAAQVSSRTNSLPKSPIQFLHL